MCLMCGASALYAGYKSNKALDAAFSVKDEPAHPSSPFEEEGEASFVETQFKTTRDAVCGDPLSE